MAAESKSADQQSWWVSTIVFVCLLECGGQGWEAKNKLYKDAPKYIGKPNPPFSIKKFSEFLKLLVSKFFDQNQVFNVFEVIKKLLTTLNWFNYNFRDKNANLIEE